ncbi:MAG: SH3 domain-containing protein [Phycisphaerae bacterium]|nr:SH3 domain-containing protein [Phycisphaerae bacterium]
MQARAYSPERCVRVTVYLGWVLAGLLAVVLILPAAGWAQDVNAPRGPIALPNEAAAAGTVNESYVAEVTGNDVFIRSGPGTQFYQCAKLYAGDRVQVIKSQQGWSAIIPPPGCFSWISMQYVSITLQNPTMGVVTGDNVGVYTGSDTQEAKYSTSKQVVLSRGQAVKLLGEEKDDYYKIAPPQGACLWVSSQFVQRVDKPLAKAPAAETNAAAKPTTVKKPGDPNAVTLTGLDLYYALVDKMKAEHNKPLGEQNYTDVKKKLAALAASKDGGRAARYADFTLKQVERYELACTVAKEVSQQDKQLQKTNAKIDEARTTKLGQIPDSSKFAVVGTLETSSVYTGTGQTQRYRILDDAGKTICYVTPVGAAVNTDFSKLIGRKVGLVGKISASEATGRAFIEFTEIVLLDSDK